jgi:hypothetical protein
MSLRKTLDGGYRGFSREYGELIESFFDPLLTFLIWFEKLLIGAPWWLVIGILVAITHFAARSTKLTVGVGIALFFCWLFGDVGRHHEYTQHHYCVYYDLYFCRYSRGHSYGSLGSHSKYYYPHTGYYADHACICLSDTCGYVIRYR